MMDANKNNITTILLVFGMSIISFFCYLLSFVNNETWIINPIILLSFICVNLIFVSRSFLFFYLFLLYIYGYFGQIISIYIIEMGVYLNELGLNSYSNGSMALLATIVQWSLVVSYLIFNPVIQYISKRVENIPTISFGGILIINIVFLFIYSFIIIIYGDAYTAAGGDRVIYRHEYLPAWSGIFIDIQWVTVLVNGFLYVLNANRLFYFFLFANLFFRIMFGEKFTMLAQLSYISFIPYVIFMHHKIKTRKFIVASIIITIILFVSIIFNYSNVEGAGFERFEQRLAQQGQLWWVAVNNYIDHRVDINSSFLSEFSASVKGTCSQGMDMMMCNVMPDSLYKIYIEKQYVLTSGYPSILLFYFGRYGILLYFLLSVFMIIPLILLVCSVLKGRVLATIVSFRLFFSFFSFYIIGNLNELLNIKTLLYIVVWMCLYYYPKITLTIRKRKLS